MDVRELRVLIGIAEAGSLSAAAQKLHLTQPALSATLRRLEEELATKLVVRHSRGVELTDEGKLVVERAYGVVREVSEIASIAQSFSQQPSGTVRLGLPTTVAGGLIPELIPLARDRYPQIKLYAYEAMSGVLSEQLQLGHLDLAVLYDIEPMSGLRSKAVLKERLDLIVPVHHVLASRKAVRLSEIAQFPLVLPSAKHSIRRHIELAFQTEGLSLKVLADIDSFSGIMNLIPMGYLTILPTYRVRDDIANGRLTSIEITRPHLEWTVQLASRHDANRPRASFAVSQLIVETCQRLVRERQWPGALSL